MSDEMIERVGNAIEAARCIGREGPFGGYDYGHNTDFYGPAPEAGRYVIRDFRDPSSPDWGKWVHQTNDKAEHEAMFEKMTREHIARAAIEATTVKGDGQAADTITTLKGEIERRGAALREARIVLTAHGFGAHTCVISQIDQALSQGTDNVG